MGFRHCLLLGAGLLLAFSCKEKPVEPEEEATKVELPAQTQALFDQGIRFEAEESGPVTLRFTVNKPWVIQVSEGKSVSWIVVEPESGPAGDAVVQVSAASNPSTEPRSATLTLSYGELMKKLTITQDGKEETPPVEQPVAVERVTLSEESLELQVGESHSLSYAVYPEDATVETVKWSSSDPSVVTVTDGVVTAVAAGEAVVSLKVNEVEARCTVSVPVPYIAVESISLSAKEITLAPGAETTLTATVLPENATDPSVSWASSDESVVTVTDGVVKALQEGTAVITARAGEKEAQCSITVEKDFVAVSTLTISPAAVQLLPGEEAALTATVLPEDATDPTVSWSSTDESVATVTDGLVHAVAPGEATIVARAGEIEARCSVTVETPYVPVTSITLTPSELTLVEGDESQLTATVLPADATEPSVSFRSSDTGVATVDSEGKVKAVGAGSATITARAGEMEALCHVSVEARVIPVESVTLSESALTLEVGESAELTARVLPSDATDPTVTWTSSAPSVASVDGGHVEALQAGTAVITAKAGGVEARCEVTVNQPYVAVESITLSQTELAIAKGSTVTLTATVLPAGATDPSVSWSSSNTRVATVDQDGKVTAVRVGTAVITAKAGVFSATCKVTVTAEAESISLNYSIVKLRPYETRQLKVNPKPSDAAVGEVVWTSSNETAATVDENGLVTALKAGTSLITAKMGELEATCLVSVSETATGGHEGTGTEVWE